MREFRAWSRKRLGAGQRRDRRLSYTARRALKRRRVSGRAPDKGAATPTVLSKPFPRGTPLPRAAAAGAQPWAAARDDRGSERCALTRAPSTRAQGVRPAAKPRRERLPTRPTRSNATPKYRRA